MQVGSLGRESQLLHGFGCETGEPHGLHQRVSLVTLHGSPQRVRVRLPARHPLLASSATYTVMAPLLRHCLNHPVRLRRYESHVSDQAPDTEYWSRLPERHLPILSPSSYAVLALLLPSTSLHAPGGTMLEMLSRSSNQFSALHTGRRTSPTKPPIRSTGPGCLRGTCPS